jgi:hypothetical protein
MLVRSPLLAFLLGGFLIFLGVVLVLSGELRPASSLERWEDRQKSNESSEANDPMGALFTGGALILVGLGFAFPPLVKWASESAFKEAVLEPPEEGAGLGGDAVVRVRLVPGQALRVASAELRLISEEQAIYTEERDLLHNDNDSRYQRRVMEVHRWSTRLPVPQDLSAPFELEVPVPIPRELPPTFNWERHMARTRLELEVVLIGRMNLNLEKELRIVSRLASGAEE